MTTRTDTNGARRFGSCLAVLGITFFGGDGAHAQIDTRARIDANNQVGSGGFNSATRHLGFDSANLYITGNVTAGRSFRAFSPVRDSFSLSIATPSSRLSNFERDSVNIADVLAGRTPQVTSPYYSPQRTTTSYGTISAGFNDPNRVGSGGMYAIPERVTAYGLSRNAQGYLTESGARSAANSVSAGQLTVSISGGNSFLEHLPLQQTYGTAATGLAPTQRATSYGGLWLIQQGAEYIEDGQARQSSPLEAMQRSMEEGAGWGDAEGAATFASQSFGSRRNEAASADDSTVPASQRWRMLLSDQTTDSEGQQTADARAGTETGFVPTGVSMSRDLMMAYRVIHDAKAADAELSPSATRSEKARLGGSLHDAQAMFADPVDSFAGVTQSAAEQLIREAEEQVRQGQYYRAKALYERALMIDPLNPLILMGLGHATLAAGEFFSAALILSRAVEAFPAIGHLKFNLQSFITEEDLLDKRRAELERRLETSDDYRFRFLLGYAEYYSGLAKFGMPNLKLAAEQAPPGSGIAMLYPLLTEAGSPAKVR